MKFIHTKVYVDDRCIDLLLTEDEVAQAFERSLSTDNKKYIDLKKCCDCWSTIKPPKCNFWNKILGLCTECDN
jgi:hypothetical protein